MSLESLQGKMVMKMIKPFIPQALEMAPQFLAGVEEKIIEFIQSQPIEEGTDEGFIGLQCLVYQKQLYINQVAYSADGTSILRIIKSVNLSKMANKLSSAKNIERIKKEGFNIIPALITESL